MPCTSDDASAVRTRVAQVYACGPRGIPDMRAGKKTEGSLATIKTKLHEGKVDEPIGVKT